jgi:hypothetical protein
MPKGTKAKSTKRVRPVVAAKMSHASVVEVRRPGHGDVALRAYEIFEREGRQHGRHEQHWLQAESELIGAARA